MIVGQTLSFLLGRFLPTPSHALFKRFRIFAKEYWSFLPSVVPYVKILLVFYVAKIALLFQHSTSFTARNPAKSAPTHKRKELLCAQGKGEKRATCRFQDHGCVPTFCPHALADYDVFSCATRVAGAKVVWPCVRMRYCLMS